MELICFVFFSIRNHIYTFNISQIQPTIVTLLNSTKYGKNIKICKQLSKYIFFAILRHTYPLAPFVML